MTRCSASLLMRTKGDSRGRRTAGRVSHAKTGQDAHLAHLPEIRQLRSDRRRRAVAWVDLRVPGKRAYALEAPFHLLPVSAGKIPSAGVSFEEDVAREQHALPFEVEARRAFGVPRGVERGEREIGDVGERSFVEEVVGIA